MHLDLEIKQVSLREDEFCKATSQKIKKTYKIQELRQMNSQINKLNPHVLKRSNRSEQNKKSVARQTNGQRFYDNLVRSAPRQQLSVETGPHSVNLKEMALRNNDKPLEKIQINHVLAERPSKRNVSMLQKLRNYDVINNKKRQSTENSGSKQGYNFVPRKNSDQNKDRLSICIEEINKINKMSQKLTRVQISATENLKTQPTKRVSIFKQEDFKTSQAKISEIKRKELLFDFMTEKPLLINHRSFSPVNLRMRNYFGPTQPKKANFIFAQKSGYLSVKGESIQQSRSEQKSRRKRPFLQRIQPKMLTINSVSLFKC